MPEQNPSVSTRPDRPDPATLPTGPIADALAQLESCDWGLRRKALAELVNAKAQAQLGAACSKPSLRAVAQRALAEIAAGKSYEPAADFGVFSAPKASRKRLIPPLLELIYDTDDDGQLSDAEYSEALKVFGKPADPLRKYKQPERVDPADVDAKLRDIYVAGDLDSPPHFNWAKIGLTDPSRQAALNRFLLGNADAQSVEEELESANPTELFVMLVREHLHPADVRRQAAIRLTASEKGAGRLLYWFKERIKKKDWTQKARQLLADSDKSPNAPDKPALPDPTRQDIAQPVFLFAIAGLGHTADGGLADEVVSALFGLMTSFPSQGGEAHGGNPQDAPPLPWGDLPADVLLEVARALVCLAVNHDTCQAAGHIDSLGLGITGDGSNFYQVPVRIRTALVWASSLGNKDFAARMLLRCLEERDTTLARAAASALSHFGNQNTLPRIVEQLVRLLMAADLPVGKDDQVRLPLFQLMGRLHLDVLPRWSDAEFRNQLGQSLVFELLRRPEGEAARICCDLLLDYADELELSVYGDQLADALERVYKRWITELSNAEETIDAAFAEQDKAASDPNALAAAKHKERLAQALRRSLINRCCGLAGLLVRLPSKGAVEALVAMRGRPKGIGDWAWFYLHEPIEHGILKLARDPRLDAGAVEAFLRAALAWVGHPEQEDRWRQGYSILAAIGRHPTVAHRVLDFLTEQLDLVRDCRTIDQAASALYSIGSAEAQIVLFDRFVEGRNPAIVREIHWLLGFLFSHAARKEKTHAVAVHPRAQQHARRLEGELFKKLDVERKNGVQTNALLNRYRRAARIVLTFSDQVTQTHAAYIQANTKFFETVIALEQILAGYTKAGLMPLLTASDPELHLLLAKTLPDLKEAFWRLHPEYFEAIELSQRGEQLQLEDKARIADVQARQTKLLKLLQTIEAKLPPIEALWNDWKRHVHDRVMASVGSWKGTGQKELEAARKARTEIQPRTDFLTPYLELCKSGDFARDYERDELAGELTAAIIAQNHGRLDLIFELKVMPILEDREQPCRLTKAVDIFLSWFSKHCLEPAEAIDKKLADGSIVAPDRHARNGQYLVLQALRKDAERLTGGIAKALRDASDRMLKRLESVASKELFPRVNKETDKYRKKAKQNVFGDYVYVYEGNPDPGLDTRRAWKDKQGEPIVLGTCKTTFPLGVRHLRTEIQRGRFLSIKDALDDKFLRAFFARSYTYSHSDARTSYVESSSGKAEAEYTLRIYAQMAETLHKIRPIKLISEQGGSEEGYMVQLQNAGLLFRPKSHKDQGKTDQDRLITREQLKGKHIVVSGDPVIAEEYRDLVLKLAHFYRNKDYQRPRPYTFVRQYGACYMAFLEAFELLDDKGRVMAPDRVKARLKETLKKKGKDPQWWRNLEAGAKTVPYLLKLLWSWATGSEEAKKEAQRYGTEIVELLKTDPNETLAKEEEQLYLVREKYFQATPYKTDWEAWNDAFDPKGEFWNLQDATWEVMFSWRFWADLVIEVLVDLVILVVLFFISEGIGSVVYAGVIATRWTVRFALWSRRLYRMARLLSQVIKYSAIAARFATIVTSFTLGMKMVGMAKAKIEGKPGTWYESWSEFFVDLGKNAIMFGILKGVESLYIARFRLNPHAILPGKHIAGMGLAEFVALNVYAMAIEPTLADVAHIMGWTKHGGRHLEDMSEVDVLKLMLHNALFICAMRGGRVLVRQLVDRLQGRKETMVGQERVTRDSILDRLDKLDGEVLKIEKQLTQLQKGGKNQVGAGYEQVISKRAEALKLQEQFNPIKAEIGKLQPQVELAIAKAEAARAAELAGKKPAKSSVELLAEAREQYVKLEAQQKSLQGKAERIERLNKEATAQQAALEKKQAELYEQMSGLAEKIQAQLQAKGTYLEGVLKNHAKNFSAKELEAIQDYLASIRLQEADLTNLKQAYKELTQDLRLRMDPRTGNFSYEPGAKAPGEMASQLVTVLAKGDAVVSIEKGAHGEHLVITPKEREVYDAGETWVSPRPKPREWVKEAREAVSKEVGELRTVVEAVVKGGSPEALQARGLKDLQALKRIGARIEDIELLKLNSAEALQKMGVKGFKELYDFGVRDVVDLHKMGISTRDAAQRLKIDRVLKDKAKLKSDFPEFNARVQKSVPKLYEGCMPVEVPGIKKSTGGVHAETGTYQGKAMQGKAQTVTLRNKQGLKQGFFERALTDRLGGNTLEFRMNFVADLPSMLGGKGVEMIPGKGTPTHMAMTFEMCRALGVTRGNLQYAFGKQIQNMRTSAEYLRAKKNNPGCTDLQAMQSTATHSYIVDTCRQLGYEAKLVKMTEPHLKHTVGRIMDFGLQKDFWDKRLDKGPNKGKTRRQAYFEEFKELKLTEDSHVPSDWNLHFELTPIEGS